MHTIRQIRNVVAHNYELISFGDRKIVNIIENLNLPRKTLDSINEQGKHDRATISQLKFISGTSRLTGYLKGATIRITELRTIQQPLVDRN